MSLFKEWKLTHVINICFQILIAESEESKKDPKTRLSDEKLNVGEELKNKVENYSFIGS